MNFIIPVIVVLHELASPSGVFNNTVYYAEMARNTFISPLNNVAESKENSYVPACSLDPNRPVTYKELKLEAMHNCKFNKNPDEKIIDLLIEVEKTYPVPSEMRGMILSAACMESGYNPTAKGDRKFSKNKKTPMAIGILQQWPVYEKLHPGMDRTNPRQAAESWMNHIFKRIPKVKRICKYRTDNKIWLAAWVTGIRAPKKGGRCNERPKHYRLLKKWHKNIKKTRIETYGCSERGC